MSKLLFLCAILGQILISSLSKSEMQGTERIHTREIKGFVYADGGFSQALTAASPGYVSGFNPEGFGNFGWRFTNPTDSALQNLRFVVFLDADIDQGLNTFFNEHGNLAGLKLPPKAPDGAIAANSWEIDEPGFLFGDLARHPATGVLDNTNAVPASARDDVALALGFEMGALASGASASFAFSISSTDAGGLSQYDPDSNVQFYFNGYGALESSECECIKAACFRSPQCYRLNPNLWVNSRIRVVIGGVNSNQPISAGANPNLIRLVLRGGVSGISTPRTPLERLNQEFVAAQLSLAFAGGQGSPEEFSVRLGHLCCYRGLKTFAPVKLSNGSTLKPESMLDDLFKQALSAIHEKRTADMDALAILFDLLNGNASQCRCN